jgi:hypothetical protein
MVNNAFHNEIRSRFINKVCEINAVANVLGKGREDFEIGVLLKVEDLSRKYSSS